MVKTTVFLKNINDFVAMNTVYANYFKEQCPARACVEVSNLPKGALVDVYKRQECYFPEKNH